MIFYGVGHVNIYDFRSPSRRVIRTNVQSVEDKVKPSSRTPRTHDNKVTSLGCREPKRAWDKSPTLE